MEFTRPYEAARNLKLVRSQPTPDVEAGRHDRGTAVGETVYCPYRRLWAGRHVPAHVRPGRLRGCPGRVGLDPGRFLDVSAR